MPASMTSHGFTFRGGLAMLHRVSWIPTLLTLLALAAPATASRVVVPDNLPTVQAAIDYGVDTVDVGDGLAPERLTVAQSVVIEPKVGKPYKPVWTSAPHIRSLETISDGIRVTLHGLRFLGHVKLAHMTGGSLTFEGCRFDSAFSDPGDIMPSLATYSIRDCTIFGSFSLHGYVQFVGNTAIGGTVSIWADGNHDIRENYVLGPADPGMNLALEDSEGPVAWNTIRGTTDGIRFIRSPYGTETAHNDIANCSGDGIAYSGSDFFTVNCDSNSVLSCGGAGVAVYSSSSQAFNGQVRMSGNRIELTGQAGVDVGNCICTMVGNVVFAAGGEGIRARNGGFDRNVIGRCRGAGLDLLVYADRVAGNTVFSNSGPGIVAPETAPAESVTNNIVAFNAGPGLQYSQTFGHFPTLACNDWFGNGGGPTVGIAPGANDLQMDPMFCGLAANDVHLTANSPLLAVAGCGLIGALGQGCGSVGAVERPGDGIPTRFQAWPIPATGTVRFSLPPASGPGRVDVFDVTGARRWSSPPQTGAAQLEWDRRDVSGGFVPPGVYFARLRRGSSELGTLRLVLVE
jgi:hypothetical protein